MFSYDIIEERKYYLVAVCINNVIYSGAYTNHDDEVITCLKSGIKCYSINDFMDLHYGLRPYITLYDFTIFDEDEGIWLPLYMWLKI